MACLPEQRSVTFIQGQATYTIVYDGMTCDGMNSTWCVTVTVTGDPALSHWVWGTCTNPLPTVLSATRNGVPLTVGPGEDVEVGTDPTTGVTGVKFDVPVEAGDGPVEFCMTLAGCFVEEPQDVGVKGGGGAVGQALQDALCGPSCQAFVPRCAFCSGCAGFSLNDITDPGQGLWCTNVVKLGAQLDLTEEGVGAFLIEQKLPFELVIIRKIAAT